MLNKILNQTGFTGNHIAGLMVGGSNADTKTVLDISALCPFGFKTVLFHLLKT